MDLGAFTQINDISKIAQANGIHVPRLRGYRLMANEEKIDWEKDVFEPNKPYILDDLIHAVPKWSRYPEFYKYGGRDRHERDRYLKRDPALKGWVICWDKIHGWKRRRLKLAIHEAKQKYKSQWETWNKYCGREDILYVHARIGGGNWNNWKDRVTPGYVDRVNDAFDPTYCDLYYKIKLTEDLDDDKKG